MRVVAYSPNGKRIVTLDHDNIARVWDARTGKGLLNLTGHENRVECVAFSPDGSLIATGSVDLTAKLWDANTGLPLLTLEGHGQFVSSLAYSPDGRRIVTSGEKLARIWDAKSGQPIVDLQEEAIHASRIEFNFNGTRIVTWFHNKAAKVWDANSGQELEGESPKAVMPKQEHSPDGEFYAQLGDTRVPLIPKRLSAEELEYRLIHTRPNKSRYEEGLQAAKQADNEFAIHFYLDRVFSLSSEPASPLSLQRREEDSLLGDRQHARAEYYRANAELADWWYAREIVRVHAATGDRLAQRLVAQELIRDGSPEKAVPLLFWCLASRMLNSPPVEELLIAKAYQKMNRPEEAKKYYGIATEWLDRPRKPMRAANVITHAINPWNAIGEAFKPVDDPRHNTFDWESWYECDVFRREVESRLAAKP